MSATGSSASNSAWSLRDLLYGPPLLSVDAATGQPCARASLEEIDAALSVHVAGIPNVMAETYGLKCEATREAHSDVHAIAQMGPPSYQTVMAKRSALLFALKREPELRVHFAQSDPELVMDLATRVLPFLDPPFFSGMCQGCDGYVIFTMLMCDMFPCERLGNFPIE